MRKTLNNPMRRPDWPERLAEYLASCEGRQFKWGQFDCCLFVCDAILAMTGVDPAASLRGIYHDRKDAYALLFRVTGKKSFDAAIRALAAEFNFRPVRPTMARRGDIVILKDDARQKALGIVDLDGRFVIGSTVDGLVRLPLTRASRAWRV